MRRAALLVCCVLLAGCSGSAGTGASEGRQEKTAGEPSEQPSGQKGAGRRRRGGQHAGGEFRCSACARLLAPNEVVLDSPLPGF